MPPVRWRSRWRRTSSFAARGDRVIHFLVGTRAQLLKMAPVMLECDSRRLAWRWVYTAQHRDTMQQLLETFELPPPDYTVVRWSTEAKSKVKMMQWFARMLLALPRSRRVLRGQTGARHVVVTHGDTFTTWLAALMGRLTRTKVMHVESGLRSFNLRKPFPEELNRLITFRLADFYACQDEEAIRNLRRRKGVKINTHGNTQIDTLRFGLSRIDRATLDLPARPFVVVTIHRYENIFDARRMRTIVDHIERIAERFDVLFIRHPATAEQLEKLQLVERLERNAHVHMLPRLEYLPFVKAITAAEFVVSDGGGNQVELSYLGVPALIFREEVEQREGIGQNVVVSRFDRRVIDEFLGCYRSYRREPSLPETSPTKTIVDFLDKRGFGG
jgi:UDP-N-acetylglucosamine 2-epimerase (non-hydrolysing)